MTQATDLGKGDDLPPAGRLDRPSHGSLLTQREDFPGFESRRAHQIPQVEQKLMESRSG